MLAKSVPYIERPTVTKTLGKTHAKKKCYQGRDPKVGTAIAREPVAACSKSVRVFEQPTFLIGVIS